MDYFENQESSLMIQKSKIKRSKQKSSSKTSRILSKARKNRHKHEKKCLPEFETKQRERLFFSVIIKICRTAKLHLGTFCLALEIFDRLCSKQQVPSRLLPRFGLVSLVLASKICESKVNSLFLSHFRGFFEGDSLRSAKDTEIRILKLFDFDLNLINRFNILEEILSENGFRFILPAVPTSKMLKSFEVLVRRLLFVSLKHLKFRRFSELKVSSAILMLARKMMSIPIAWTADLIWKTGYTRVDLEECETLLKNCYIEMERTRKEEET